MPWKKQLFSIPSATDVTKKKKSRNKLCSNLLTYCSSISYKKDVVIPYFSENIHECYSYTFDLINF